MGLVNTIRCFLFLSLFALCAMTLGMFLRFEPPKTVLRREPAPLSEQIAFGSDVPLEGTLAHGKGVPSVVSGAWPFFRGENHDGIAKENLPLIREITKEPIPELWRLSLGYGYAGAAVKDGRVYVLDYDMAERRDALRCLSLEDGREIWRFSYPVKVKINHGMSRSIPALTERYCVTIGPKCHVACVDRISGEKLWLLDLTKIYGSQVPLWYSGQCPLVVGETLILAPAGKDVLLCGIDLASGKELWRTPNPFGWSMTHVSVVPMQLDGRETYVYCGSGGVVGVCAKTGEILWSTTEWQIKIATCPSPVVIAGRMPALPGTENRIFFCGGYGSQSTMLRISKSNSGYKADVLFRLKPSIFGSTQQTPVFYENHLFGVREKDGELVCLDLSGNVIWSSGSAFRFGLGPYFIAEGKIFILGDNGDLTIAEANTKQFKPLGTQKVLDGHEAWAPMALVSGRLILRDFSEMRCLDVSRK